MPTDLSRGGSPARSANSSPLDLRLVVLGASGFIGSTIARHAEDHGLVVVRAGRESLVDLDLDERDLVIGCAIHPLYRALPYRREHDLERAAAERVARSRARMMMLSTRRVYPSAGRWNAGEDAPASGDETQYGRNKAETERHVLDALGSRACILRLSNVFGFEYAAGAVPRKSFFGLMLSSLKKEGEIVLDVSGGTRRDFIPVADVASSILSAASAKADGVFNLGCGQPLSLEKIANAVIGGYGGGLLRTTDTIRDEFYLNITKWTGLFGRPTDLPGVLAAARRQGECLRHA